MWLGGKELVSQPELCPLDLLYTKPVAAEYNCKPGIVGRQILLF